MSKRQLQYLRNEQVEDVTAQRLREYEAKAGVTLTLPVPIENIVEQVLGLDFDWDTDRTLYPVVAKVQPELPGAESPVSRRTRAAI